MSTKIHLIDIGENEKVPDWEENKLKGYKVCKCGYHRKRAVYFVDDVTCKICLKKGMDELDKYNKKIDKKG